MKNLKVLLSVVLVILLMSGLLYGQEEYWYECDEGIYYDDGNVGIGTEDATERLTINGNIKSASPNSNKIYFRFLQSPNSNLHLDAASNYDIYLNHYNGNNIRFGPTGNWMFVKNNGNVGIGTINPEFKLDVDGEVQFNNINLATKSSQYEFLTFKKGPGTNSVHVGGIMWNNNSNSYGDGNDFVFYSYDNRDIVIRPNGTDVNTIFKNCNVGIGTTNPEEKLDVSGKINLSPSDKWGAIKIKHPSTGGLDQIYIDFYEGDDWIWMSKPVNNYAFAVYSPPTPQDNGEYSGYYPVYRGHM